MLLAEPSQEYRAPSKQHATFKENSMTCRNAAKDMISERHSNSQQVSSEPRGSKQEGEIVKVIK